MIAVGINIFCVAGQFPATVIKREMLVGQEILPLNVEEVLKTKNLLAIKLTRNEAHAAIRRMTSANSVGVNSICKA